METSDSLALNQIALRLQNKCIRGGWWIATAESCTGGMIAHTLTNNAGSSACVLGGIVAYDNAIKISQLGVSSATLQAYGAVSEQTALEMAQGVRAHFCAAISSEQVIGISTTGIAGPGGGSAEKPVGLVYIGIAAPAGSLARRFVWQQDRPGNKTLSTFAALALIEEYLDLGVLPPA